MPCRTRCWHAKNIRYCAVFLLYFFIETWEGSTEVHILIISWRCWRCSCEMFVKIFLMQNVQKIYTPSFNRELLYMTTSLPTPFLFFFLPPRFRQNFFQYLIFPNNGPMLTNGVNTKTDSQRRVIFICYKNYKQQTNNPF